MRCLEVSSSLSPNDGKTAPSYSLSYHIRREKKKKPASAGMLSSAPRYQTNHASVEAHFLPRYVARGRTTTMLGGCSLSHLPRAFVGSKKDSLSLNATTTRTTRNACTKTWNAFEYGGLVTTQSGCTPPSPNAWTNSSDPASKWVSAAYLGIDTRRDYRRMSKKG